MLDVFVLNFVVQQQIVDHTGQECNVRPSANRRVIVCHGCRAREPRIHHHELGFVVMLGFNHPLEAARVGFSGVAAHDQNQICIFDIGPMIGHCTSPKRRSQTGYRRGVSNTRLVIEDQHPHRTHGFVRDVARLIG